MLDIVNQLNNDYLENGDGTFLNIQILDDIYNDLLWSFEIAVFDIPDPELCDIDDLRYFPFELSENYNIVDNEDYNEILFHLNKPELDNENNDVILESIKRYMIDIIVDTYLDNNF